MKIRSPRSSFHHFVVTRSGSRRSSSRPNAIAEWRTLVNLPRGNHRVTEVRPGLWIEVEPQLVRVINVVVADGPRVERDRVHLGRPRDDRDLGRTHLVRGAP